MTRTSRQAVLLLTAFTTALVAALLSYSPPVQAETTGTPFIVNSTGDAQDKDVAHDRTTRDGRCSTGSLIKNTEGQDVRECTLRAAIEEANSNATAEHGPQPDAIAFDISKTDPGYDRASGVFTIAPSGGMPEIEDPLTIDGYTQPGAKENTLKKGNDASLKIELSGTKIWSEADGDFGSNGLTFVGDGSVVRGLVINDFQWGAGDYGRSAHGIMVHYANNVVIEGNFIGTDATGTKDLGNEWTGVAVMGANNVTVGGNTPAARNLISGNDGEGIGISGEISTRGNKVQGNYIGTDKDGTKDLGNDGVGVSMSNVSNTTVGGKESGAGNIIAFNSAIGVRTGGGTGNRILSNSIFSNKGFAPKEVDPDDPLRSAMDPLAGLGIDLGGGEDHDNWYSDSHKYGITPNLADLGTNRIIRSG